MAQRTVFVRLLDKGEDVWSPVEAEDEGDGVFRLLVSPPQADSREFAAGMRVVCEYRRSVAFVVARAPAPGPRAAEPRDVRDAQISFSGSPRTL